MKIIDESMWLSHIQKQYSYQSSFLAMYSSWFGGVVTDPNLMMVSIDDHMVHRGDAVFEAMKVVNHQVFLLDAHLDRMYSSAEQIYLTLPLERSELKNIIFETLKIANSSTAMIRLFVSRGPGGFGVNPYESIQTQIYVIVTKYNPMPKELYQSGCKIGRSQIPAKTEWMATIKSCNYLSNVLMKKEAVDRKLDFTIGFDSDGFLTEGATENILIINHQNELLVPKLTKILRGTTLQLVVGFAEELITKGKLSKVFETDITEAELIMAKEAFMCGTTLDVLPIRSYESGLINKGTLGDSTKYFMQRIREEQG